MTDAGFHSLVRAFEEAAAAHPQRLHAGTYVIAGGRARIRVVGRTLADCVGRPFAHLRTDEPGGSVPDLSIDLWDESETGVACRSGTPGDGGGSTWPVGEATFAASPDRRFFGRVLPDAVAWLDRERRRIVGWAASTARLSLSERGRPLLPLLSVACDDRDVQLIHAGLVARDGDGVLLGGSGGAGKSTSALACLCAGFAYLGDDCVALEAGGDGVFRGHSVYGSTQVEPAHLTNFPSLVGHALHGSREDADKALVLLSEVLPARLARVASIRALALPRVVDAEESRIRPITKRDALLGLAPSSVVLLVPRPGARGLRRLAELVERVPSYRLELGRDLERIPHRVQEILEEVGR